MEIRDLIPNVDVVLRLAPEELAYYLLRIAKETTKSTPQKAFHPDTIQNGYPADRQREIVAALNESWQWLRLNMLIIPQPGINGNNGWMVLTRRGEEIASKEEFIKFQEASAFPKALLHSSIADKVWLALARGDLDIAVFIAFKTVEEAVRDAGGFSLTDIGVPLMRKAFDKKDGPLIDIDQPDAEREALCHLFAGAIGSYKNPHSHRTVSITDPRDAQEMVLLASHLLRIVDARQPRIK